MEEYRFGIVGCGLISDIHAKAIHRTNGAELVGVCDNNAERAKTFGEKYNCAAFSSLEDMLASGVDVVCICTPSGLHAPMAVKCAAAGKHVIIEKPLALDCESAAELIEICDKNRVFGTVISQNRFSSAVSRAKNAIEKGLLGKIVMADLRMKYNRTQEYYSGSKWRGTWEMDGGGALMNQGIHGVDIMCYLLGYPTQVKAFAGTLTHDMETEDNVCACLHFENGAVGILAASTSATPPQNRRLEIHGEKGCIILSEDVIVQWCVNGENKQAEEIQRGSASNPAAMTEEGHLKQIENFIDILKNGGKPFVSLDEGARCVKLITDIYKSAGLTEV